jgi:uncharacterized protein
MRRTAAESPGPSRGLAPTKQVERSEILDVIRGFALLGVVVINWSYAGVFDHLTFAERQALPTSGVDRVVQMLDLMLFESKFYAIFAVLFGLGFALQLGRAASRGQDVTPTYARRLGILLLVGLGHAFLLYYGDILHVYALLGFALIPLRQRTDRVLLGLATGILLFLLVTPYLEPLVSARWPHVFAGAGSDLDHADRLAAVKTRGWRGIVWFNAHMLWADSYPSVWEAARWYLDIFWRFLFGFWVGRHAWLQHAEQHLRAYRRLLPWALLIGLAGTGLHVSALFRLVEPPPWLADLGFPGPLTSTMDAIGAPALALSYVCLLVLAYQHPGGRRLLGRFAPVGRMALTNYLAQSVLLVVLFFGVGLGLAGRVGIGITTLLALLTFVLQIAVSRWWLARFRFGPAEWVWRCCTYKRRVPLRRAADSTREAA